MKNGHYIGKDLVHYGSGIVLDPECAYGAIAYSARKNIRKAEQQGFSIQRRAGTPEELLQLRALWYYPEDPNFPDRLAEDEILYLAFLGKVLVGGMILIPVGSHLFLNNLTAGSEAKKYHLQGYLLWHAVNDLKDSGYRYIDIGASYRVNLHRFFSKWSSFHYPIIFNPPELKPDIRFQPFRSLHYIRDCETDSAAVEALCGGRPYTVLPSMQYAREVAEAYDLEWNPVAAPQPAESVQILDLTELFPLQYGALLIGLALDVETIWSRFGCYDHFKMRHILNCLSLPGWDIDTIGRQRAANHCLYEEFFAQEDMQIEACVGWIDGFRFCSEDADILARRFNDFGIQVRREADRLVLPCHQALTEQDIEYIYAVYRGYLNLCSEWESTAIKGSIKLTGS